MERSTLLNVLFALEGGAGFLLDLVVAAVFGMSAQSDALYAAWLVPQALGRGIFQGLTNSFLGLFADQRNDASDYNRAITIVLSLALPLAAVLSVSGSLWLPLTIPAAPLETKYAAVPLVRILAFIIGFSALTETFRAIHYRERCWWLPSVGRLFGTSAVIGLIWIARSRRDLTLVAWALVIGTGLEAIIGFAGFHLLLGARYRPLWPSRESLQSMKGMIGAPLLGQGVRVLAGIGERALASTLAPGSVTAVAYANRIINTLEHFVFRGFVISTIDARSLDQIRSLRGPSRLVMLISIPIATVLSVLARPLVAAVFGRGSFSASDVQALAITLQMYGPAVVAIALSRIPFGLSYAKQKGGVILGFFLSFSVALVAFEALLLLLGLDLRSFGVAYTLAMGTAVVWLYCGLSSSGVRHLLNRRDIVELLAMGLVTLLGTALFSAIIEDWAAGFQHNHWIALVAGLILCVLLPIVVAYALQLDEIKQVSRLLKGVRL